MVVTNLKSERPFIWIPPNTTAAYKITIERSDGTIDDISDFISMAEFEDNITESVGKFEIELWNPNEEYTNIWLGNEIVRYYKDYASTATTLRFRGRIEKPSKRYNKINLKGRSEGLKMLGVTVTKSYTNVETSVIVKDLFSTYLPSLTTNNVGSSTTNLTLTWSQKPLMEALQELAKAAGFEFYLGADLDFRYFNTGSIQNQSEAIVHGMNLLDIPDFTPDLTLIKNRVIVYGAVVDGVQVLASAEQKTGIYGTDNEEFGVRELIVNDENITEETTAQEVADYELSVNKEAPKVGNVKGWLLASIQPGEKIRISSPSDELNPTFYNTTGYKDKLDVVQSGVFSTTVFVNKEPRKLSHILRDRVQQENKKKSTNLNPEEMRFSYNFLFEEDVGAHTNTEITDGVLKPTAASGTWISPLRSLDSNMVEAYILELGQFLPDVTVSVSGNNGISYQAFTSNKTKLVLSGSIGAEVRVKVVFSNADAQLSALSLLYKT